MGGSRLRVTMKAAENMTPRSSSGGKVCGGGGGIWTGEQGVGTCKVAHSDVILLEVPSIHNVHLVSAQSMTGHEVHTKAQGTWTKSHARSHMRVVRACTAESTASAQMYALWHVMQGNDSTTHRHARVAHGEEE